ncbi:MAG: hypothetical protein U0236_02935 [Nitrospira sp.]
MKPAEIRSITLCVVLVLLDACTINGLAQSTAPPTVPVETHTTLQMRPSDRMFYWLEESRELHAMATHREREAELVLKKKPGPATDTFVTQMRLLAHQLHEAAEYADVRANEAEQEIPPNMIKRIRSALP